MIKVIIISLLVAPPGLVVYEKTSDQINDQRFVPHPEVESGNFLSEMQHFKCCVFRLLGLYLQSAPSSLYTFLYRLGSVLLQLSISGSVALLVSLFVYTYLTDTDFDALHQRCDGQTFTNFTNGALFFISPNESSSRFSFKRSYFANIANIQCSFCICNRRPFLNQIHV